MLLCTIYCNRTHFIIVEHIIMIMPFLVKTPKQQQIGKTDVISTTTSCKHFYKSKLRH